MNNVILVSALFCLVSCLITRRCMGKTGNRTADILVRGQPALLPEPALIRTVIKHETIIKTFVNTPTHLVFWVCCACVT